MTVRDCVIRSGAPVMGGDRRRGAVYFHNCQSSSGVVTDQHIELIRNEIYCADDKVFYLYDSGRAGNVGGYDQSVMDVLCIKNTFWSETAGAADTILGGDGFTPDVTLHPASWGNNVAILNAA